MIDYNLDNCKRVWILGDVHFGVRSSNMEWFEITKSYFEDFFIPLLEKEYKEGDILIQLGDIFENRQIVNLKINSYVVDLFERLGKILPVILIAGNHDIYYKRTNDITSLDNLKFIPNIKVLKEEELLNIGGKSCLLMPWRHSPEHESDTLNKHNVADFVFCHSEMQGVLLNAKVKQEEGTKVSKFKNYKRVYSGHIHFSQLIGNVVMVGNAYQMTRSDIGNAKGVYILDLDKETHEFHENLVTPQFRKINLQKILDIPLGELKDLIRNNFNDFYISSDIMIKYNISHLINLIQSEARSIDPNIYDEKTFMDVDAIEDELQSGYKNFDVLTLCNTWIGKLNIDEDIKDDVKNKVKQLYIMSTSSYNTEL